MSCLTYDTGNSESKCFAWVSKLTIDAANHLQKKRFWAYSKIKMHNFAKTLPTLQIIKIGLCLGANCAMLEVLSRKVLNLIIFGSEGSWLPTAGARVKNATLDRVDRSKVFESSNSRTFLKRTFLVEPGQPTFRYKISRLSLCSLLIKRQKWLVVRSLKRCMAYYKSQIEEWHFELQKHWQSTCGNPPIS